jgi:hypothetical protein
VAREAPDVGETPTGGLLFPAGEEIFTNDLKLKAIVATQI